MTKIRFEKVAPEKALLLFNMNRFCGESAFGPDQEFGLELELEGFGADMMGAQAATSSIWVAHQDPSLRGDCTELVLRKPMSLADLEKKAMPIFSKLKKTSEFKPHLSNRCSLHTHIDFSHKSLYTLCKFVTLYALCEQYFFAARGPKRKGNHFCISLLENPNFALQFVNAVETGNFQSFNTENLRYMALNFHSLWKFGSVEIRLHEGEADEERILSWVRALKEMVDFAQNNYKYTPEDYLYQSSINGLDGFLKRELPKTWEIIEGVYYGSRDSVEVAQDFAFGVSWANAPKEAVKTTEKKPLAENPEKPPKNAVDVFLEMEHARGAKLKNIKMAAWEGGPNKVWRQEFRIIDDPPPALRDLDDEEIL